MITIVKGDILNSKCDIIAHQVNNCGVMGAGLAAEIREKFPKVYTRYFMLHKEVVFLDRRYSLLGEVDIIPVDQDKYIANMYSQDLYGRDKSVVYTDYYLFEKCIRRLYGVCKTSGLSIAIPYNIGCGFGNGDPEKIHKILYKYFDDNDINCVLYDKKFKKNTLEEIGHDR